MTKLAQTAPERIKELKEFLNKTKNPAERERARAVWNLIQKKPRKDVADYAGVHIKTLDEWGRRFRKLGTLGIKNKPQKGNNHLFTKTQRNKIISILKKHKTPEEVGVEGKFWNVGSLRKLTRREFNICYRSPVSYRKLFARAGYSSHKPNKVNSKRNESARRRFETVLKKRSDGTVEKMVWYW